LYNKLSYDARDVVKSDKFKAVFPDITLADDKQSVSGWNTNKAGHGVSYFGAGVGGTIIGFGATKVAITDDLFRSMEDALSETIREKTHSWKGGSHDSRMESGCAQIDIGTRWVRDDVIGLNSSNGYYDKEIVISALTEEGNSFCEAVMTTDEFLLKKKKVSEEIWMAEYMQKPVDIEGRLFEKLKLFNESELEHIYKNSEGALTYIDVADEGADYLALATGHIVGNEIYITDLVYTKANTDVTIPMCVEAIKQSNRCMVETNNMGAMFYKALKNQNQSNCVVSGMTNTKNKQTRIFMQSSFVLNTMRFLSTETGEYGQFIQALKTYSHEGKNKNDDAPDCIAGLSMFFKLKFSQFR
jgi:predicted phage terminase large subunit-like protein